MYKHSYTAIAMAFIYEVMEDRDVPAHLRTKAEKLIAEYVPEALDLDFAATESLATLIEKRKSRDNGMDLIADIAEAARLKTIASIKPTDLRPAPADGKLERMSR